MPDLVKFILVILAIWVVYQVFTTVLFTLSQKAVAKQIKSGKMSDQQLANLYHAVARANQGSNFQAIFSYGLFTAVMQSKVMRFMNCIAQKWRKEICCNQL